MSIGSLRNRITFQKLKLVINENGFEEGDYEDFLTVWAKVVNLSGKEYFEAAAVQKEKTVKFYIRAGTDIDEDMRIKFKNRIYDITFINNIDYKNKYIEIKGLEVDENVQDEY